MHTSDPQLSSWVGSQIRGSTASSEPRENAATSSSARTYTAAAQELYTLFLVKTNRSYQKQRLPHVVLSSESMIAR